MSTAAKRAKTKATALHSQIVRARGHCRNCGGTQNLQTAHIISRRYAQTRTDLDNAFCLDAACHMRFTEWPLEFADFVEAQIGLDAYNRLVRKSQLRLKVDWEAECIRLAPLLRGVQ